MNISANSRLWTNIAILVALVGGLFAAMRLMTWFAFWDDEGYMLLSFAHYMKQGHLYTQTYSQYGPFYFYAQGFFFQLLHFPLTHDMGRLVTLIYWSTSSLLAAVSVCRISKSTFLACAAGICVMLVGVVLTNEPGHPQQVVLLLYMTAILISIPSSSVTYRVRFFLLGCVGAALIFTKINVGVFYIAGLTHALVCLLPLGKIRSTGIALTLSYAAAVPWLLMHAGFNHGARDYCIAATVAGVVTFACGAVFRPARYLSLVAALYSGAGLATGTALIVISTSLQGMSLSSLISGVLLAPLNQPGLFFFTLSIGRGPLLAGLILCAGIGSLTLWSPAHAWSGWLDALRLAAGISAILLLTLHYRIEWVAPMLPLTLIPQHSREGSAPALFSRLFITDMAVTQFLEPYPVAGSQLGIAAAPMILWAFLCIADGIAGLREASGMLPVWNVLPSLDRVAGGTILVLFAAYSTMGAASALKHLPAATSDLQGSAWLRLPPERTTQFNSIVKSVQANCGTLFTMPGMGSFNMWSGIPTPNGFNLTAWMRGLSLERQAGILSIMKSDPTICAVLNRRILRYWDDDDAAIAALPLARYIMTEMPRIAQFGEYEIHVHPDRKSPWLVQSGQ